MLPRLLLCASTLALVACPPRRPPPVKNPPPFDPVLTSMIATLPLNTPGCQASAVFRGAPARNFTARPLFATRARPQDQSQGPVAPPPRLARFCKITPNSGETFRLEQVDGYRRNLQPGVGLAPDFPLVSLSGEVFEGAWGPFREAFLAKAGVPGGLNALTGLDPVRIAVVDSNAGVAPDWAVSAATSGDHDKHGVVLARLLQELTCVDGDPGGVCLAEVRGYPALNTTINGVTVGSQGDLAAAIYDATFDAGNDRPWVLNLSLGWAPIPALGGEPGSADEGGLPGSASVHEAIEFAVCNNAVVFAAAGNDLGGPGGFYDDGPVYPARWEGKYGSVDCGEFGIGKAVDWPMVSSVAAIDLQDRRLSIARRDSFGTLAAYGFGGVALREPNGADPTTALSGSSVATAIASAAAAVTWALEPTLDAGALVSTLHKDADQITASTGPADVPRPDGNKSVAHLRVCKALQESCNRTGTCGTPITCPTPPPVVNVSMGSFGPPGVVDMSPAGGWVKNTACTQMQTWVPAGGAGAPYKCPEDVPTSVDEEPWVNPQPGADPCDPCVGKFELASQQLNVAIERAAGLGVDEGWIVVELNSGNAFAVDIGAAVRATGGSLPSLTTPILLEGLPLAVGASAPFSMRLLATLSAGGGSVAGSIGMTP